MAMIERYRHWYEHERDSNRKMLAMIESVPQDRRADERFARAVVLAAHLSACRENWLDRMINGNKNQVSWWPESVDIESLAPRYEAMEGAWSEYLANLTDEGLGENFEFTTGDGRQWRWGVEGQIVQLVGHAFYHRGQIALLVEQLGGTTVDTDYLYWEFDRNPIYGPVSG